MLMLVRQQRVAWLQQAFPGQAESQSVSMQAAWPSVSMQEGSRLFRGTVLFVVSRRADFGVDRQTVARVVRDTFRQRAHHGLVPVSRRYLVLRNHIEGAVQQRKRHRQFLALVGRRNVHLHATQYFTVRFAGILDNFPRRTADR